MFTGFIGRKGAALIMTALSAALLSMSSCVSTRTKMLSESEMANVKVVGAEIETKFNSFQLLNIPANKSVGNRAYDELAGKAKRQYQSIDGNIDVANVKAKGGFSAWEIVLIWLTVGFIIPIGNVQNIVATADVICSGGTCGSAVPPDRTIVAPVVAVQTQQNIDNALNEAIERATSSLIGQLRRGSAIAVFNVDVDNWKDETWVIGEIEKNFVQTRRFTMIDRSSLDAIIKEQEFQTSGAVNDRAVVKIGELAGAKIVITGSVSKSARRLSLKALDVETGEIVAMENESFDAVSAAPAAPVQSSGAVSNSDGFEMVFVQGGTFTMGCDRPLPTRGKGLIDFAVNAAVNAIDGGCPAGTKPTHSVTLSDYSIGKFEVTQKQWESVMGMNPSKIKGKKLPDNLPVENVNWDEVQEFIERLNAKTGKKYRLPTEAEWEYAARGGNKTHGYWFAGSDDIKEVAVSIATRKTIVSKKTAPVGSLKPNELGIYDMSGNVSEWVSDDDGKYTPEAKTNPMYINQIFVQKNITNGTKVFRGGSWAGGDCLVFERGAWPRKMRFDHVGFRLVLQQ